MASAARSPDGGPAAAGDPPPPADVADGPAPSGGSPLKFPEVVADATAKAVETTMATLEASAEVTKATLDKTLEASAEMTKATIEASADVAKAVIPKVEPLPFGSFLCLSLWVAVPPAGYILLNTDMGYADQVYYYMAQNYGHYANIFAGVAAGLLLVMYLFDAENWSKSRGGTLLLYPFTVVLVAAAWLYIVMIADVHPYGIICLFAILNPVWLLLVKALFYSKVTQRTFVSWLGGPFLLVSALCVVSWLIWLLWDEEHEWDAVTQVEAAQRTGCVPDFEPYPGCRGDAGDDAPCFYVKNATEPHKTNELVFPEGCDEICLRVYSACLNGFLPWVGPLLVAVIMLFLSFCTTFLRTDGTGKGDIINFGKVWIFIVVAMWITASFAGSTGGVIPALTALTLASFMGAVTFVSVSFSRERHRANVKAVWDSIEAKYGKTFDWARGFLVLACGPILLVYLALSVANQAVRRCGLFPCSKPARALDDESPPDIVTKSTRKHITAFQSWDRAKVFTYAVYLGFAVVSLLVLVAKLVVLFLSWLIVATQDVSLGAVTGIMVGVGVAMFLIPVIPGIPVYLCMGIVLPAKAYESMGWPLAILYATGVALVLKLLSSVMQQVLIGQAMSGSVKVRQAVSVNSPLIKSMRLILGAKGLTIAKVGVLVGGPDWPTSVLCGILRLEVIQIMIGTIPVICVIAPTCASGALSYMMGLKTDTGNPQYVWASMAFAIVTAFSTCVQFAALLIATFYIEFTTSQRSDELALIPIDEEVKEADERDETFHKCYGEVTQWHVMPLWPKIMLQASLVCIVASSYMSLLFAGQCFEEHALTDTIEENLGGEWHTIIKPLGWVVIGLFIASIIFLMIFSSWGKKKAREKMRGDMLAPRAAGVNDDADTPLLQHSDAAVSGDAMI